MNRGNGKTCIICSANEAANVHSLWPPDFQREQILTMAARIKNFITKLAEEGNPVTNPHMNLVQFLKDITRAMVGNKRVPFGEALLKAISHYGIVRVPSDRVTQIFMGKRGRQYTVIREEFRLEGSDGGDDRFAYRVSKDYGNVFYKDYLKMILGREFADITDYDDTAAEKCGDVVEMWLGLLDIANMTKKHIKFMDTRADPGELLAGLKTSINVFQGTTRSSSTSNTKRNKTNYTRTTSYENHRVNQILYECPVWNALYTMCLIEDREIEIINEMYLRSLKKNEDDPMGQEGQGEGVSHSTGSGAASSCWGER